VYAKQHKFTASDIARAAEVPESKVRRDIRTGKLVPSSLRNLSTYVIKLTLTDAKQEKENGRNKSNTGRLRMERLAMKEENQCKSQ